MSEINILDSKRKTVPSLKSVQLQILIRRLTTDSQGIVLDDAVIPDNQKQPFPFHLFGEADRQAAYSLSELAVGQFTNWKLFGVYVGGIGTPLFFFSPVQTINAQIKKGDVVFVYVDTLVNPDYFHFVILSAPQGGYAMLTAQTMTTQLDENGYWGAFQMDKFLYTWQDDDQIYRDIYLTRTNLNGGYKSDTLSPSSYLYTQLKPDIKTIQIPLDAIINQYFTISSFITFENKQLNFSLTINQ